MDLFNFLQPAGNNAFYMRMAAVNQMSQMMHGLSMNPMHPMGTLDPLNHGIMAIDLQPILGSPMGLHALRHSVPSNPWVDLFSPGLGSSFQSMSVLSGDPNIHSYCSSTMMSMTTGPDGRPLVYQATSSTRAGPGGVCEVQKSVCDNVTGTKKLQIGRHIGNRGHVIEREQNLISGEREEREDFINIEEDEAETFSEEFEWRARVNRMPPNSHVPWGNATSMRQQNSNRGARLALPSSRTSTMGGNHPPPTNGWTENPSGTTWYSDQYGNSESPRYPYRGRQDHIRSSMESHLPRRHIRPRKGRSSGDSHPYSCEKIRKRDHCRDEIGCPLSNKTPKTSLPDIQDIE